MYGPEDAAYRSPAPGTDQRPESLIDQGPSGPTMRQVKEPLRPPDPRGAANYERCATTIARLQEGLPFRLKKPV
jgi:hypothetical protein